METASETPTTPRPTWHKTLRIAAIALAAMLLLAVAAAFGINTGPGRAFLVKQVNNLQPASGLRVHIGRIDGSLYSHFTVRDLRLFDLDGEFLQVPVAEVAWKPGPLVRKHVVLERVHVPGLTLLNLPRLNQTPQEPDQPLFPDINMTLGQLAVERIVIGPKVAGQEYVARAQASGALANGQLTLEADASADAGDRLRIKTAIAPEADRLDLDALLTAPVGGVVSGMANLDQPLSLTLDGAGGWSRWDGALTSRLGGGELLALNIAGRSGVFTIEGRADPALYLQEGPAAALLAQGLEIASTIRFEQPRIATTLKLTAPAFVVEAAGGVNSAASRFEDFRINAGLTRPEAAMDGLSGRNVALSARLDGPIALPAIAFDLKADRIGYEAMEVVGLRASGDAALTEGGNITTPVSLSIASVSGVNEAVAGLLTRFRLEGVVKMTPEQVAAENVTFKSAHLSGRASAASVRETGAYKANVAASLNRYAVPGFGVVNAVVNAALGSDPRTGALSANGDLRAEALRLDNDSAREFFGGRPVLEASVRQLPNGDILVRRGTVQAPRFNFTVSRGVYTREGVLDLAAAGQSAAYGPLSITAAGPAQRPEVRVAMARPDLGIGLQDVQLAALPETDGYAIGLTGASPQGDLNGKARLTLDNGPIAAEIAELRFADLRLSGKVQQTREGPFAGALALAGAGFNGSVRLAAEGEVQRADLNLQARRARPPMLPALAIGEARVQASLRLPESGPDLNASLAANLIQYHEWRIEKLNGGASYTGGRGKADLTAEGRYKTPFNLTLGAQMEPEQAQVDLKGSLGGRPIRLAEPAVAEKTGAGWRLRPATLRVAGGRITLEGETGAGASLRANWANLDLRLLDAVDPELGFSGLTAGNMRFAMPADGRTPNADLRMVVSRLQRTGLTTISPPLDLGINAALSETQAAMRMLLRHEKTVVGSMQARLDLRPSEEEHWADQLRSAPLAGGLRFDGPVELLWAMSGLKGQELGGTLTVAADMGGTVAEPRLRGSIRTADMAYENVAFGTRVQNLTLDARFSGSRLRLVSLSGTTPGGGKLAASGYADLNPAQNFPMNVKISLENFQAARTDAIQAVISGPVTITRNPNGGLIAGELGIIEARYRFTGMAAAEVPQLAVQRVGEAPAELVAEARRADPTLDFDLDVKVRADNRIFIEGMGLDSEWGTNLTIGGTVSHPQLTGTVEVVRGNYAFAGRRFDFNRGIIRLGGEFPPNPTLDIEAGATVEGIEALLLVTGPALKPEINFSSSPVLPQDEILSRLLFGGSAAELSATEALQLGAALASLRGGGGGLNPLGKIRQATSVDRLRIVGADETTGRGTSLAVGQYLTDDVYVEVSSDTQGNTLTQLQIELTRALSILSQVGQTGSSSLQLQYAKDY